MNGLPMKMFCWSSSTFLAIAQAKSVDHARAAVLKEMGGKPDGSSAQMTSAWQEVNRMNPQIWQGPDAEFALTDSALLEEADEENARLRKVLTKICGIASERESDRSALRNMTEIVRLCEEVIPKPKK